MASYVSIHVASANKTLVPWTIVTLDPVDRFVDLYQSIQVGKFSIVKTSSEISAASLESVWIGKDKAQLSQVDKSLNVSEVCSSFGQFIKFVVLVDTGEGTSSLSVTKNAFVMMMNAQRTACQPSLPRLNPEKTKKDKLFNDIVNTIDKKGLKFSSGQLESGKSYITTLTSTLWYIDQHHCTLATRGYHVPDLFKPFSGYKRPELSKHRKRDHNSLNADKLSAFASSLYDSLLLAWLNTPQWASFREATEQLARAVDFYVGYLRSQNKKMKTHHLSEAIPIADKTSVELLPVNLTPSKSLTSLSDAVSTKGVYEQIFVGDYIPSDSREKYHCIQDLRRGLRRPCVLCTCSVGGPVGNYLFIWPIQDHVSLWKLL